MGRYLAIDIGASSGRHIIGTVRDGRFVLEEAYRFANSQISKDGHDCWDIDRLVESVEAGIDAALAKGPLDSIAIDTWGVDFVLLDSQGNRCSDAVAYRDARTAGMDREIEEKVISFADLYSRCGIQKAPFNTIYQLWALKKERPDQLERAAHFLTVPEYLVYRLTGNIIHEYTHSSTTSLLDAEKKDWDRELISMLGLPVGIFGKLEMPGAAAGEYKGVKVVLAAMHDTGSAFLGAPVKDGEKALTLSSGTWSLLGVERPAPILTPASMEANFTNEGGAWGRYRYLKNIMGLWPVQCIRRELNGVEYVEGGSSAVEAAAVFADREPGREYSFGDLAAMAGASGCTAAVDIDDARFLNPRCMAAEVASAMGVPKGNLHIGDAVRCVYNSLAASYAKAVEGLSRLTGTRYDTLHIIGGGCRDTFLNSLAGQATGLKVVAGPVEATATGNLIVQSVAAGEFSGLAEAREAIPLD